MEKKFDEFESINLQDEFSHFKEDFDKLSAIVQEIKASLNDLLLKLNQATTNSLEGEMIKC